MQYGCKTRLHNNVTIGCFMIKAPDLDSWTIKGQSLSDALIIISLFDPITAERLGRF